MVEIARYHAGRLVTFDSPVRTHELAGGEVSVIDVSGAGQV
jgi:hypothetical protein